MSKIESADNLETSSNEKTISLSKYEEIVKTLYEEILRKDKKIEELKLENIILLKTALKRAQALDQIQQKMTKVIDEKPKAYSKTLEKQKA